MPFSNHQILDESPDKWTTVHCSCNLDDEDDPLVRISVEWFRNAYGEERIVTLAQPDAGVESKFDLTAIRNALRLALPSVDAEGDKPPHLTNYRSEPTEVLARCALGQIHGVRFPVNPQLGKTNVNMPVLGFDGWGLLIADSQLVLVLVQVKGTEDEAVPPSEAKKLAGECAAIPKDLSKLARALSIMITHLEEGDLRDALLVMLAQVGNATLPEIVIAPVIVRGTKLAAVDDLQPIRDIRLTLRPARVLGLSISVGLLLSEFGRVVITKARAA